MVAGAVIGVVVTWTSDGAVELGGTQGPNNGWLVLIVAGFALGWLRSLERGSPLGAIGVLGSGLVIAWTAIESWAGSRAVVGASAGLGLLLVLAAASALAFWAVARACQLARVRKA